MSKGSRLCTPDLKATFWQNNYFMLDITRALRKKSDKSKEISKANPREVTCIQHYSSVSTGISQY